MADLSGSPIATTYDRLLALPSGGLQGATLAVLTDGNAGGTASISITDNSTGKSLLSIDGSHANGTALQIDNSATTGDVSVEWQLGGTTTWLMGIDDSDSNDPLKICHDSTMGSDERLTFLLGSTVFNEDSGDIDFRVEGNGNANLLFCDAGNDRVGIGTNSPTYIFDIDTSTSGRVCSIVNTLDAATADCLYLYIHPTTPTTGGHWIECANQDEVEWAVRGNGDGGAAIYEASDRRIKENIIEISDALTMVNSLKPRRFNRKNVDASKYKYGFIADEFIDVFPNSVAGEADGMEDVLDDEGNLTGTRIKPQSIATNNLFGVFAKAIQELSSKVEALENA